MADRDRIKYAKSGDVSIAYVVSGNGPPDLVFVHGFAGNIEIENEIPFQAAFLERLADTRSRVLISRYAFLASKAPSRVLYLPRPVTSVRSTLS